MGYYSDPTASRAIGNINREFSRFEKKAKKLCRLLEEGVISYDDLEKSETEFKGIYKHVLRNALKEAANKPDENRAE